MLKCISEERLVQQATQVELHYITKSRDEALFLDKMCEVMNNLGDRFKCHLWFTRQEIFAQNSLKENFILHRTIASSDDDVAQRWEWWNLFLEDTLRHLDNMEKRDRSLIYICGPQGLTDRLLDTYKRQGMKDGSVQIEKWW